MSPHILLLKTPDETNASDPYQHTLSSRGLSSTIIPTLSHTNTDPDQLAGIIGRGGGAEYGGVIITSTRAVDAWVNASRVAKTERSWNSVPFYVVGPRTEKQLLDLRDDPTSGRWIPGPELVLGAKESGTGESLARFIRADYPARDCQLPLLYLTGDKNAGGIEAGLEESGIGVRMVQVYATCASPTFEHDFEQCIGERQETDIVIAFFAPSSAELALPVVQRHFSIRSTHPGDSDSEAKPVIKVAAIGPTTARALTNKHHLKVDAISTKPDPEALTEAILSVLNQHSTGD